MPDSRLRVNLRALFHLAATAPKTALSNVSADSGGELLPDFVATGSERHAEKAHRFCDDFSSATADRP